MSGMLVYRSNRLEALTAFLTEHLRRDRRDPMEPIEVVVGSRGMERHLRLALSQQLGVCANLVFPFPASVLDTEGSAKSGVDPWSPEALVWSVLEVLPEVARSSEGAPLARYLDESAVEEVVGARAWALASALASVFDGYAIYRPDWLDAWDPGKASSPLLAPPSDLPPWQIALWRALRAHIGPAPHRGERLEALKGLAPRDDTLHVFGLSGLAAPWLRGLAWVGMARPVCLYLLEPTDQYWSDLTKRPHDPAPVAEAHTDPLMRLSSANETFLTAGHPLLHAWGQIGRARQVLLEDLPEGFEPERTDLFLKPIGERPTVLRQLQDDILFAVHPSQREGFFERLLPQNDTSVQVHSCHGATRQVEVLRTALLGLLDADPTLQPRDIVVMTPDIDTFAPRIGAVFDAGQGPSERGGWLPSGSPRLPWELADLAVRRVNPVADALLRVVELVEGRGKASEVLGLLALEPVADRFDIGPNELATLQGWVVDSGIRWGVSAEARAQHDQPEDVQNTWRFGLERLLMGVMMSEDERLPAGVRPFESVEGGATHLVGRFVHFCATLFDQVERLRRPRPVVQWSEQLGRCVEALTLTSDNAAWLTRRVREALADLGAEAEVAGSARQVGVDAVRAALVRRFEVASTAHHGAGGAITFCGMVPERAVPYRVVCLLGMDEGSFPRAGARPAFDLLQQHPRVGDRDPRDEDRYLLLEALLSARDHLVVLYAGRDVRTNEALPPAVPVSELFDALDATWPHDPEHPPHRQLLHEHPLQAFDPRNFGLEGEPFSYDARLLRGVEAAVAKRQPPPPFLSLQVPAAEGSEGAEEVALHDVVHFWRHPIRSYLQRSLRIYLDRDDTHDVPDREPLELGWLDRSGLLDALLEGRARGLDADAVRAALAAEGRLPLGGAGRVAFAALERLAAQMAAKAEEVVGWAAGAVSEVDVDVVLGAHRLVGRVPGVTEGGLVRFVYGSERPSDLLEVWTELLALRAQAPEVPARALLVFGKVDSKGKPEVGPIGLDATELEGHSDLQLRVALRGEGLRRPLPFFPKTSQAVAKVLIDGKGGLPPDWRDPDRLASDDLTPVGDVLGQARAKADATWSGGFGGGEGDDRYYRHAFGAEVPYVDANEALSPDFLALAARCWWPIREARRTAAKLNGWRPE